MEPICRIGCYLSMIMTGGLNLATEEHREHLQILARIGLTWQSFCWAARWNALRQTLRHFFLCENVHLQKLLQSTLKILRASLCDLKVEFMDVLPHRRSALVEKAASPLKSMAVSPHCSGPKSIQRVHRSPIEMNQRTLWTRQAVFSLQKKKKKVKLQVILRKADFQNKQGLRFLGKKYSSKHSRE